MKVRGRPEFCFRSEGIYCTGVCFDVASGVDDWGVTGWVVFVLLFYFSLLSRFSRSGCANGRDRDIYFGHEFVS